MAKAETAPGKRRKVIYPEFDVKVYDGGKETPLLTAERMKIYLGWTEVETKEEALFKDLNGRWIRLRDNPNNVPFDFQKALGYSSDMLKKQWKHNGQPLVFGRTGLVISAQHRGVALILAQQRLEGAPVDGRNEKHHWEDVWGKGPIAIHATVTVGVAEDDDTINTVDTGGKRSEADAIYRSAIWSEKPVAERLPLARMTGHAVRLLWDRTRAKADAYTPTRSHSDMFDFIDRHPNIRSAVEHIFVNDKTAGRISDCLSPGYAAGLLYLMGANKSDGDTIYRTGDPRSEKLLDMEDWDRACEYWTLLAAGASSLKAVLECRRPAIEGVNAEGEQGSLIFIRGEGSGSLAERKAVLILGWGKWASGTRVTAAGLLKADYYIVKRDDAGLIESVRLSVHPQLEGIDLGDSANERQSKEDHGSEEPEEGDPTLEQIEEGKAAARNGVPVPDEAALERAARAVVDTNEKKRKEAKAAKGKGKPGSHKAVEEAQTQAAVDADAALARETEEAMV